MNVVVLIRLLGESCRFFFSEKLDEECTLTTEIENTFDVEVHTLL